MNAWDFFLGLTVLIVLCVSPLWRIMLFCFWLTVVAFGTYVLLAAFGVGT